MKLRLCVAAPLLLLGACATPETLNSLGINMCEKSQSCTVSDQKPRHGPQQQRAVEDELEGRQEPM